MTPPGAPDWFAAPWRLRGLRRLRVPPRLLARRPEVAADLAFWNGVRAGATPAQWRRLTRGSYAVLVYHRLAGEGRPGQERVDLHPRRFRRQLRALRVAGFRPVAPEALTAFHAGTGELPRRAVVLTLDDATADAVEPLLAAARWRPQLFACTREAGGTAHWLDGEPVAAWSELRRLAAGGVAVGSHGRRHRRMTPLDDAALADELRGSLADLRGELPAPLPVVAYPNGDHDARVCAAAREAGYVLGYTTLKGRNGARTDPHALRRVSVHAADGALAVLWKAVTGEGLPGWWLRARRG